MKDLIRSPLQTVLPMTDSEWQDLVKRETCREINARKRRVGRPPAPPAPTTRRNHHQQLQQRLEDRAERF